MFKSIYSRAKITRITNSFSTHFSALVSHCAIYLFFSSIWKKVFKLKNYFMPLTNNSRSIASSVYKSELTDFECRCEIWKIVWRDDTRNWTLTHCFKHLIFVSQFFWQNQFFNNFSAPRHANCCHKTKIVAHKRQPVQMFMPLLVTVAYFFSVLQTQTSLRHFRDFFCFMNLSIAVPPRQLNRAITSLNFKCALVAFETLAIRCRKASYVKSISWRAQPFVGLNNCREMLFAACLERAFVSCWELGHHLFRISSLTSVNHLHVDAGTLNAPNY